MARSRIIAGKAVIIIEAQDLVNKTLGKVRSNLHRFSNEVGKIGEGLFRTGFFGSIASGVAVNSFVKFDDAMRTLRVNLDLFGKSAKEVDAVLAPLEARIRSLAQTTPFNPTQVAQAATELAKGGFNPQQIEKALQAVLDLARATNTELGFSAEFVVRTLTTYGIATEKASEVVSQLVRASRKGTLGIEDLEAAMRYSSGTADTLGVSLQKMLAIFTVLSNRGLVGSIAGTSTNTAFSQLVKKAQELKDIGKIELVTGIREDGREALDVISSLQNLFKFAETLPFTEQQTLFQDVFNLRGARSVSAIRREIESIKQLTGFIADANQEAREAARIQDAGIGGSLRRLLSTVQDLGIALGQAVEIPITNIANTLKGLVTELNKLATLNPVLTSLVVLSPGILLGAGAAMLVLAKGLRVAAYSAGLLKGAFAPLSRFFAKGTVQQISLAAAALRQARGPAKAPSITRRPVAAAVVAASQTPNNALLLAQNQRNAVLAIQRRVKAEELLNKAEKVKASSNAKLASSIKQVNIAQARNNTLLAENTKRVLATQKAEQIRVATDRAIQARQSARAKIDALLVDRQRVQASLARGGASAFENDALRFREEGLNKEIALARKRANSIRPEIGPVRVTQRTNELLKQRAALLTRQSKLDTVATSLTRGKTVVEGRYIKQLTKGQDLLISSAKAQQAIQKITLTQRAGGIGRALGAFGASTGRGVLTLGKNLLLAGKGFLSFLNIARRFVFSASGVLTILEGLILFGDRIPGVSSILSGFGQGFSNAFKAIGNIAKFAAGPIALFKASIEAFNADRSDLGVQGLASAFTSLASIIGNQLLAAWNRFKEAIAPVYDFIVGLFNVVDLTIRSIVESIAVAVGSVVSVQSRLVETFTGANLFGSGAQGFLGAVSGITEGIAKFIPSLFNWIANFAITFSEVSQKFLVGLEYVFNSADPRQNESTINTLRDSQLATIESGSRLARRRLELNLKATLDGISEAFNQSSTETSRANANRARNRSANRSQQAFAEASAILAEIRKKIVEQVAPGANFGQGITPQRNPLAAPEVQSMKLIAEALVGSVESTRRNLRRSGKPIEQKQLEEQQKTNELLGKMATDQGILFAP